MHNYEGNHHPAHEHSASLGTGLTYITQITLTHEHMFRRRFWISTLISIPVLLDSQAVQGWVGFGMPAFSGSQWVTPVFSVAVSLYGGLPFLSMAVPEIRGRRPGMMLLISLAISTAFLYSLATLVLPGTTPFFWELVTLIDIMLLGHWIEMRSIRQASGALDELAKLMPDEAGKILDSGETETVSVHSLKQADRILVRPGASVPADGEVIDGELQRQRVDDDGGSFATGREVAWIRAGHRRHDQRRWELARTGDSHR